MITGGYGAGLSYWIMYGIRAISGGEIMVRRILAIEKSYLARNVYQMVLSKLGNIEFASGETELAASDIRKRARNFDLIIAGHDSIGNGGDDLLELVKEISGRDGVPCVILASPASAQAWEEVSGMKGIAVVEKPFFPADFIKVVGQLLENK